MIKATVLLVIACAWLFTDRHSLNDKMTSIDERVQTMRRQNTNLEAKLAALENQGRTGTVSTVPTVTPKTWLQDRIEKNHVQSPLETADRRSVAPPYVGTPRGGVYSSGTRTGTESYPPTTVVNNHMNNTVIFSGSGRRPTPQPQTRYIQRPTNR
jgi:hypothetical protein